MDVKMSDLRIDLNFGLSIDALQYEAGYQTDRYDRVLIRIKQRDAAKAEISELTITMPSEYARTLASEIVEATIEPPDEVVEKFKVKEE